MSRNSPDGYFEAYCHTLLSQTEKLMRARIMKPGKQRAEVALLDIAILQHTLNSLKLKLEEEKNT